MLYNLLKPGTESTTISGSLVISEFVSVFRCPPLRFFTAPLNKSLPVVVCMYGCS